MKSGLSGWILCAALAGGAACWSLAQDSGSPSTSKSQTRTITGCLSKGDSASELELTGNDGSMWEVRSTSLSLADHVGHIISATGVVSNVTAHNLKEEAKNAAADARMTKDHSEHGHMTVTKVEMVSDSCQK